MVAGKVANHAFVLTFPPVGLRLFEHNDDIAFDQREFGRAFGCVRRENLGARHAVVHLGNTHMRQIQDKKQT